MKTMIVAAGFAAIACPLLADLPVGRGIFSASITTTATYDSNVFGTHDATSDYFGTVTPRIFYERESGLIEADANTGIAFIRYLDQTQLNAENVDASGTLKIVPSDFRNYSGSLFASYRESSDVDTDINARVNSKTTNFGTQNALVTGVRTDVFLDANYTDIQRDVGSNQQLFGSQLGFNYKDFLNGTSLRLLGAYDETKSSGQNLLGADLNQKSYSASAGLGRKFYHDVIQTWLTYGYRILDRSQAETSSGVTRQSGSFISASIDGPFLPKRYFPKVQSRLSLLYQEAATPGVNDTGSKELTGTLQLQWQARETTLASFSATRSQRLSSVDQTVVSTALLIGVEETLRYNLKGNVSIGYNWDSYPATGRDDETILFTTGLDYAFARSWTANATYRLSSATSSQRSSSYDRQIVSLSVTYRF